MKCDQIREALSARMDGEAESLPAHVVEQHLGECAGCRLWLAAAESVTRSMRVQPATAVPDLTSAILAEHPAARAPKWIMPKFPWLRIALAWVGFAQFAFGLVQLVVHLRTGSAPVDALHVFSEGSSWNVAMGCGLMYAAWRTPATVGLLPLLTPFAGLVAVVTVYDVIAGVIAPIHIVSHSMLVAGLALLFAVHRQARHSGPTPRGASIGDDDHETDVAQVDAPAPSTASRRGRHLRPASRAA